MTLSVHAIAGAGSAILLKNYPILALVAAFLSHFLLDSIPHWHYKILSKSHDSSLPFGMKLNLGLNFLKDISRGSIDFCLGLIASVLISLFFFPDNLWIILLGAFAGALPDFLQAIYYLLPNKLLFYFQKFHQGVHSIKKLDDEPVKGIFYQVAILVIIILAIIIIG
ncbi:MAG: hypothetical protein AAB536_00435 [Patescibacteria group bacterium]